MHSRRSHWLMSCVALVVFVVAAWAQVTSITGVSPATSLDAAPRGLGTPPQVQPPVHPGGGSPGL